ncbi:SRPBCC family protein [Pseudalkalibacillus decolorationis]|uniref:SRPBCC family protein n=1 Tax=Pseudalkalibacillus decolorationis TaxID=163879 RepID=UPI002147ED3E|nr:SRPBCC family protein [Pseudalkalibacillus decolorationis]
MKTYCVAASKMIEASPERVYQVISDMDEHRNFLPKEFESVVIEKGGIGEGTVFRLNLNVMGKRSTNVMTISEPEPGRVIIEKDAVAGITTIWTISPGQDDKHCDLQLVSEIRKKPGFAGLVERILTPYIFRSIYKRELDQLNAYVKTSE